MNNETSVSVETLCELTDIAFQIFKLSLKDKIVPIGLIKEKQDRIEVGKKHCPHNITNEDAIKLTLLSDLLEEHKDFKNLDGKNKTLLFNLVSEQITFGLISNEFEDEE